MKLNQLRLKYFLEPMDNFNGYCQKHSFSLAFQIKESICKSSKIYYPLI